MSKDGKKDEDFKTSYDGKSLFGELSSHPAFSESAYAARADASGRPGFSSTDTGERKPDIAFYAATGQHVDDPDNRNPWASHKTELDKLRRDTGMGLDEIDYHARQSKIKNFKSAEDAAEVKRAWEASRTTQSELDGAIGGLRSEFDSRFNEMAKTASKPEEASKNMSYNQYLAAKDASAASNNPSEGGVASETAKATGGYEQGEEGAQSILKDTLGKVSADGAAMGKGKVNQGKYVLSNLGSDKYNTGVS